MKYVQLTFSVADGTFQKWIKLVGDFVFNLETYLKSRYHRDELEYMDVVVSLTTDDDTVEQFNDVEYYSPTKLWAIFDNGIAVPQEWCNPHPYEVVDTLPDGCTACFFGSHADCRDLEDLWIVSSVLHGFWDMGYIKLDIDELSRVFKGGE